MITIRGNKCVSYDFINDEDSMLVVVDMQEDFINGSLGSKHSREIVPFIVELVSEFKGTRVFTKDTHYVNYLYTQEGKNLPIIHTQINTEGWEIVKDIKNVMCPSDLVITKDTFGSDFLYSHIKNTTPKHVYIVGVKTAICVISNAVLIKTASPETVVHVVEPLCSCVTDESHKHAIETMKMLQIDVIGTVKEVY